MVDGSFRTVVRVGGDRCFVRFKPRWRTGVMKSSQDIALVTVIPDARGANDMLRVLRKSQKMAIIRSCWRHIRERQDQFNITKI